MPKSLPGHGKEALAFFVEIGPGLYLTESYHTKWKTQTRRNCLILRVMISQQSTSINGIKELIRGYQICNTSQLLIFGGYVCVRGSLYIQVIICVNIILDLIDIRTILLRCPSLLLWYIEPNGIGTKISSSFHTLLLLKNVRSHYRYLSGITKRWYQFKRWFELACEMLNVWHVLFFRAHFGSCHQKSCWVEVSCTKPTRKNKTIPKNMAP